jgi:hypothetical protein
MLTGILQRDQKISYPVTDLPLRQEFLNRPNVVREIRFHRRGHSQGFVNPAEVVIGEVQGNSVPEVFPLLAEAQRQSGQPFDLRPHREVLALNMGR